MNSLEALTTNSEWIKFFIDRTDDRNKVTPMNKLFKLNNLCLYWNANETEFFNEENP